MKTKKAKRIIDAVDHTYYIKSKYYPESFIDALFQKRGNWRKLSNLEVQLGATVDFMYMDDFYYIHPKYYEQPATVKNTVNDAKRSIALKNKLMKYFAFHPRGKFYSMPQKELDLLRFVNAPKGVMEALLKRLFNPNKVYIFKSVPGFAGTGIRIFTSWYPCMTYIQEIIRKFKGMWTSDTKEQQSDIEKMKNRIWVLQEYITNPYLIMKGNKGYKFHIRHFYVYQPKRPGLSSYYKYRGRMALADRPYVHGQWDKPSIHDTHFHNQAGEVFPDALNLSPKELTKVMKQIDEFYSILNSFIKAECYPESEHCFELFGVDLMLTEDLDLKVLEVNHGIGLGDSTNLSQNKQEIFEGIMELVVDPLFPPAKKVKGLPKGTFVKIKPLAYRRV